MYALRAYEPSTNYFMMPWFINVLLFPKLYTTFTLNFLADSYFST